MSIESHLVSLRTYLEEISSQNKEILAELKRTGKEPYPAQKTTEAFLAATKQDEAQATDPKTTARKTDSKPQTAAAVEKQLEAETGRDFVKTGSDPVTLAESDKPAPKSASKKQGDEPVEMATRAPAPQPNTTTPRAGKGA